MKISCCRHTISEPTSTGARRRTATSAGMMTDSGAANQVGDVVVCPTHNSICATTTSTAAVIRSTFIGRHANEAGLSFHLPNGVLEIARAADEMPELRPY